MDKQIDLPLKIQDKAAKITYTKGKLLGKGGFAKCFEFINKNGEIFACKIIIKSTIKTANNKEKLQQEIMIHKTLSHVNIVQFNHYFDDASNVYILLELCPNKTLLELHKRRKHVTEPETRYFVVQIARACAYLHSNKIIHRDLKLANIFLDKDIIIKIGDFGLATKLDYAGQRKKTMCGTPNYIAPEILRKEGHSFEVDVWSVGCIIYTLLVGRPPFETENLRDTYARIKKNEYFIPFTLGETAHEVIRSTLDDVVRNRPTMVTLLEMSFFKEYTPKFLPKSVLTTAPRFDQLPSNNRALANIGNIISGMGVVPTGPLDLVLPGSAGDDIDSNQYVLDLQNQVTDLLKGTKIINADGMFHMLHLMEDSEDPTLSPIYWVSKWVDYSDRYGLGYQLIDGSNGVVFNDSSRIILTSNNKNIQYIDKEGKEQLHTDDQHSEQLNKKITLLHYFQTYMNENLMTAGENKLNAEKDALCRLPYVKAWFRTKSAIVLYLSNGTFQMNLFSDHTKLVLCPLMSAITYIDGTKDFKTFKMDSLKKNGYTKELYQRLDYSLKMIQKLSSSTLIAGKVEVNE